MNFRAVSVWLLKRNVDTTSSLFKLTVIKNGDFYWVDAYVTPLYENGEINGYQSVRTCPTAEQKIKAEQFYNALNSNTPPKDYSANTTLKRLIIAAVIILALLANWFFVGSMISIIILLLCIGIIFTVISEELFLIPNAIEKSKSSFDSPSRLIYTGKGLKGLINYPVELYKAKVKMEHYLLYKVYRMITFFDGTKQC